MFKLQSPARDIAKYAARYSSEDDRTQRAMGRSAGDRGWYTRGEFGEICRCKTPRSGPLVVENSAAEVKAATRVALAAKTGERERMHTLGGLRGVDWATASVLLHLAFPSATPFGTCVRSKQLVSVVASRRATPAGRPMSTTTAPSSGEPG
jgi:hypothetical protein